jgi:glycosyltransferase involved in cell wall biosynthesis
MSYALAALPPELPLRIRVLDTRGSGASPLTSLGPLARTCVVVLVAGLGRRADVVHVNVSSHGSALRKGLVVRTCRLARLPVVLHLHASSFPEFLDALPAWARAWVRRTFTAADTVVVLGRTWREYAVRDLGVDPGRVVVLPNATPAGVPAAGDGLPHLVFLGRLGARKGLPELLAALADDRLAARAWRATLAGDGEVAATRAEVARRGLAGRVVVPGWIGAGEARALLGTATVLVLPSRAEGLPMSVLEAFASGVPVVATTAGALGEVVRHEGNGLVVPPGDAPALADALVRLLDDESTRARLAAGAADTWRRHHDVRRYAVELAELWSRAGAPREHATVVG